MATYIGKCLYCDDGIIEYESKQVRGKKTKVYSCSNNKVTTLDDGETWEPTSDSTCSWKLFGSSLERWGKKFIGPKEVKKLLAGDEVIAHMFSYVKKVEYKKYLTISEEYGVSVLWEMDVEEEINDNIEKKPYKKVYSKEKIKRGKRNVSVFSKDDRESLVLPSDLIDILSSNTITQKQYAQKKTPKEFENKTLVKPVFVNKKYTDPGTAF